MLPEPENSELFGIVPIPAYQPHSATSRSAAEFIAPKVTGIAAEVLELLTCEALTDADIALRLERSENSTRPRRIALEREGKVIAAGIGTSPSGRPASLWRAVQVGEPPGTRQGPAVGSGAGRGAVNAGQRRHTERTAETERVVGALWTEVRDCRPTWMSQRQHQGIVKTAIEANPGDIISGLKQALRDLRAMGGGR